MKLILTIDGENETIRRIEVTFARTTDEAEGAQIIVDKLDVWLDAKLKELTP